MKNKERFGERLQRFRKRKKITQQQMGDYLGVKHSTISSWENGKNGMDIKYLDKVCRMLEVTLSELLGYDQVELAETEFKSRLKELDPREIIPRYYSLPEYAQDTVDRTIDNYNDILIAASGAENVTDEQLEHNKKLAEYYHNKKNK